MDAVVRSLTGRSYLTTDRVEGNQHTLDPVGREVRAAREGPDHGVHHEDIAGPDDRREPSPDQLGPGDEQELGADDDRRPDKPVNREPRPAHPDGDGREGARPRASVPPSKAGPPPPRPVLRL